jgi:mRNA interferase RelE/StbE
VVRVFLTRTAREALAALDLLLADAVLEALGELERDPHLGHQLRQRLTGLRCYRVGVYSIIYELRDDKAVRVVAIRHRGDPMTARGEPDIPFATSADALGAVLAPWMTVSPGRSPALRCRGSRRP